MNAQAERRKASPEEQAATEAWENFFKGTEMQQPAVKWCKELTDCVLKGETPACIDEVWTTPQLLATGWQATL